MYSDVLGMPPQTLQVVVGAGFFREDVDQVVSVVRQHPIGVLETLYADRVLAAGAQLQTDLLADGLNLPGITARTNDEEVREGGHLAQIEHQDIGGFLRFGRADCGEPEGIVRGRDRRRTDGCAAVLSNRRNLSSSHGTLEDREMRHLWAIFFSIGVLTVVAQTPLKQTQPAESKQVELAKKELQRIITLVDAGALPRVRLEQAQRDVADAEDEAILEKTLYGDFPAQNLNEQMADDMVAAAMRRVDRQKARYDQAKKLVDDGISAQSSLVPVEEDLHLREMNLKLARSRAKLIGELASIARYEQAMQAVQSATHIESPRDSVIKGMEHYEGNGVFIESRDLKPLEIAFTKKFDRALPISADGETALHRSLGFDHTGRVDVALDPRDQQGIWLRRYLKSRLIPYYAFTRAIRGKATAAHIHIGPGSTRLHSAD